MSDKIVTEREAVKRERLAFISGYLHPRMNAKQHKEGVHILAAEQYPIRIEQPRIMSDPDCLHVWRVRSGNLEYANASTRNAWYRLIDQGVTNGPCEPTSQRIRLWADLLANPTEEVIG